MRLKWEVWRSLFELLFFFCLQRAWSRSRLMGLLPAGWSFLLREVYTLQVCVAAGFQAQSDELFIKAQPLCFGWRSKQILLDYHTEHQPCSGPAVSVTLSHLNIWLWPQYLCELTVGVAALVYRCPQESDDWLSCCRSNKMALYKNTSVIKHKYLRF